VVRNVPDDRSRQGAGPADRSAVMMVVTLFFPELCHPVETMAYFLARQPGVRVRLATSFEADEKSEHPWSLRRIQAHGEIEVVAFDGEAQSSDLLLFYLARSARISGKLSAWRARARSAVYLSRNEGPRGWKDLAREAVRSFPHYIGAR